MSLDAFLNPPEEGKKIKITMDRFKDNEGNPGVIEIGTISAEKNAEIVRSCKTYKKQGGIQIEAFDSMQYQEKLMLEMIISPNFRDRQFVEKFNTLSPTEAIKRCFNVEEYTKITNAINSLIGDNTDLLEEAKN